VPVATTDGISTYYEVYGSGPALMMGSGSFDSTIERFAGMSGSRYGLLKLSLSTTRAFLTIGAKQGCPAAVSSESRIGGMPTR
jgi:hypothetical protein